MADDVVRLQDAVNARLPVRPQPTREELEKQRLQAELLRRTPQVIGVRG